jgi:hypothetical protein
VETKSCTKCGVTQTLDRFQPRSKYPARRQSWCRGCVAERARQRRTANLATDPTFAERERRQGRLRARKPEARAKGREWWRRNPESILSIRLKHRYGITLADRDAMIAGQGGVCAVCRGQFDRPNVDHDHATGRVRGVLCTHCNLLLGCLERVDDATVLAALAYIGRAIKAVA